MCCSIDNILFQSLICRALFPRVLRSLIARVSALKENSVVFAEHREGLYCIVSTWDDDKLQSVFVGVEALGQRVPCAELSCLSRVIDSVISCQFPISI